MTSGKVSAGESGSEVIQSTIQTWLMLAELNLRKYQSQKDFHLWPG